MPVGFHACSIPRNEAEQFAIALPFLRGGVEPGHKCLFVASETPVESVRRALSWAGFPEGSVSVVESDATPLGAGVIDAEALVDVWEEATDAALREGFTGLRVVAEMGWARHMPIADLTTWELHAALMFDRKPLFALCQYLQSSYSKESLHKAALRTHSHLLLERGRVAAGDPEEACAALHLLDDPPSEG